MAKTPSAKLGLKHKLGYGAGDAGGVVMLVAIGQMNRYIQNILGVPATVLATMLLIWNIWDAVNDPLVGTFMDVQFSKAKNKTEKFRPWILRSIPILAFGLIAFFSVPNMFQGLLRIVSLFILKIMFELGYTIMNIGMGSLLGVMATNDAERATLSSARGFGSTVGGMVGMIFIPQVLSKLGETTQGYMVAGIVAAVLGCLLVFIHFAWTEERNVAAQNVVKTEEEKEAEKVKITDILNVFKVNRSYLALCIHSICICFVQGISQGAANYMYADVLGDIGIASMATMISTPVMFGGLIVAPILAKKFDLVAIIRTFILVGCIMLAGCFAYSVMVDQMIPMLYVVWSGVGTGLVTLSVQLQWGLVGESIDYNEYLTGKRSEGAIYGTFSLTRRIGQTLSASLAVLMISWFGYVAGAEAAAQPASAILGIKMMCILIPAVIAMGSWAAFTFVWDINKDTRAKMAAWKAERAAKAAEVEA
ncbi:MAG: MFS transporter [Faecalibacterium sp.]|nr:MFS transporter [Faecalibacterium sp.]